MRADAKIYVAGHRGLVGSAICRVLSRKGYGGVVTRPHGELDLTDRSATEAFFREQNPEYVVLAAARVGGIRANSTYPADFIRDNLAIELNVIDAAWRHGVKRLMFLGSSCIYPRACDIPIREEHLLSGPLEATNRPYALAKIAGIELCWSYNRQFGTRFMAAMPCNLYGPGDNYHPEDSHVIPGLIRRFHEAKLSGSDSVTVWGTGRPRREFLYSDDLANACVSMLELPDPDFDALLWPEASVGGEALPPLLNVGASRDVSIAELAAMIRDVVGFEGELLFDESKPDGTFQKLMDSQRMERLGWEPLVPLRDGLASAYADFLERQ